mgnify:CR=1 FL=1
MKHVLKVLLRAQGFLIAAFAMFSPIYAIFVERIGGGILAASGSVAAYSIATGLMIYVISRWEDHVKHLEKMVRIAYALSALGFLGYIFVQNITQFIVIQVLLGLSVAIRAPALDTLYSRHTDHKKTVSEWGDFETMVYIVGAIAALVGGYIAKTFGFNILFMTMFLLSVVSFFFSGKK